MSREGRIFQLNTSRGGVPKRAVETARVTTLGLAGDQVKNKRVHGGPDRAVCLYSRERIEALRAEGHPIFAGALGENVTVAGLDWDLVIPGARLETESVTLEITRFARPCATTAPFVSGKLERYHQESSPGWSRVYARVLREGTLATGETIRVA